MGVRLIALSFLMPSCRVGPHDVPWSMLDWNGAFPPFRIAGTKWVRRWRYELAPEPSRPGVAP
jgi:hypothetical protein